MVFRNGGRDRAHHGAAWLREYLRTRSSLQLRSLDLAQRILVSQFSFRLFVLDTCAIICPPVSGDDVAFDIVPKVEGRVDSVGGTVMVVRGSVTHRSIVIYSA
jgi:hypothetical protein